MLRDLFVFQLKIFLDGLKDIALAPASLVAGILGLFSKEGHPGRYLSSVMRAGKGYEKWIDLYSALDKEKQLGSDEDTDGLDGYVERLERALVARSQEGGMTTQARAAIENALAVLAEDGDDNAVQGGEKKPPKPDKRPQEQ